MCRKVGRMKLLRFGWAFCLLRQMRRLVEKTEIPIFPAKAELQAKKDAEIKVENERKQVDSISNRSPTTPIRPEPYRFGLFPVRSPLLRESLLFSLPPLT